MFSHVDSLAYAFIFTFKRYLWDMCFEYMSVCVYMYIYLCNIRDFEVL